MAVAAENQSPLPITFLSDYGVADDFAGVCRAVIARIAPGAQVIDLTHGIRRHDVRGGAGVLADSIAYAPIGVHLAIVDPGVGSARRPVAVRSEQGNLFVGPDNGLLPDAIDRVGGAVEAVDLTGSSLATETPSMTFHGRDVFAPVAAHLAIGRTLAETGTPIDPGSLERQAASLPILEQHSAVVHADRIDGFGNVALDLTSAALQGHPLAGAARISVASRAGRRSAARARAFDDVPEGGFLFYEDSSGRMAIAVNRGSAAEVLEVRSGDELELEPAP